LENSTQVGDFDPYTGTGGLFIGGDPATDVTKYYCDGQISDARVYDRALTATEVAQLASGTNIQSGLIGHWPLVDNANDTSTENTNNGTVSGATFIGAGSVGEFDGTDDYIDLANSLSDISTAQVGSFSAWVYADSFATTSTIFALGDANTTTSVTPLHILNTGVLRSVIYHTPSDYQYDLRTDAALSTNTWYHVVIVQNGTEPVLYVDGVAPAQTFFQTVDKGSWFGDASGLDTCEIGSVNYNSLGHQSFFDGKITDAKLYNRALSATEVTSLYDKGRQNIKKLNTGNLNKGLVGHWPLTTESLQSSTVVADYTPNDNTGTLTGGALIRDCPMDNCGYSFDGVDDSITVSDDDSLDITSAITVSGWIKGNTQSGARGILSKFRSDYDTRSWTIYSAGTSNKVTILITQSGVYPTNAKLYTTSIVVLDDLWHHVSFTFTSDTLTVYIDGIEDTGITKTTDNSVSSLYSTAENVNIGSFSNPTTDQYFSGSISDTRIYDRVLTATEVSQLYSGTNIQSDLVGRWPLLDDANDAVGTNNGTVTGATLIGAGSVAEFDGTDDWITVADDAIWDMTSELTTSIWFKTTNTSAASNGLLLHDNSNYKYLLYLSGTDADDSISFYTRTSTGAAAATMTYADGAITDGNWYHVVGVFDKSLSSKRLKTYVNGNLVATADGYNEDITAGDEGIAFAHWNNYYQGVLSDGRVYNRALSATEVQQLYDRGRP
jgi:hypothetical protein